MLNKVGVLGEITGFFTERDSIRDFLQNLIKNIEYPLDERWEIFLAAGKDILGVDIYGDGHIDILSPDLTQYDHFYTERYQTRTYEDMWEQIQEKVEDAKVDPTSEYSKGAELWDVDKWRETVLEHGHAGFIYDW
jgi:hypothetical protein